MRHPSLIAYLSLALAVMAIGACSSPPVSPAPSATPEGAESMDALLDRRFEHFLASTDAYGALRLSEFRNWQDDDPPPFILDVRTEEEAAVTGHIRGAVRIPLQELADRTELLPGFDTTIVTYCGSGWRCTMALPVLAGLGWNSIYTLSEGSLSGWVFQGYPVDAGLPPEPSPLNAAVPDARALDHWRAVLSTLPEDDGAITPDGLDQALKDGNELVLLDIRQLEEIQAKGRIPSKSQLQIPIDELTDRRGELPKDKGTRIVTYCGSGYRCLLAMMMLRAYGYTNVRNLVGGLQAWEAEGYPIAGQPSP
jgi:rhodanese-related sulfurtransferase